MIETKNLLRKTAKLMLEDKEYCEKLKYLILEFRECKGLDYIQEDEN